MEFIFSALSEFRSPSNRRPTGHLEQVGFHVDDRVLTVPFAGEGVPQAVGLEQDGAVDEPVLVGAGTTYTMIGVSSEGSRGLNLGDNDSVLRAFSWTSSRKSGKTTTYGVFAHSLPVRHENVGSTLFFHAGC
jgi:hypothetical protein